LRCGSRDILFVRKVSDIKPVVNITATAPRLALFAGKILHGQTGKMIAVINKKELNNIVCKPTDIANQRVTFNYRYE